MSNNSVFPFLVWKHENNHQLLLKKAAQTRKDNDNENTSLSYYLKQGMTQEEAEQSLKDRQRTFTLEKCINKYGEEKGRFGFN